MIERYTLPEMGRVWSEAHKYELWCSVEVMVLEAHAEAGTVPADSVEPVRRAPPPTPEAVAEIEAVTQHDVIAFLTAWADRTEPREAAAYVHFGMTSSDLLDTALALQLVEATDLLLAKCDVLVAALRDLGLAHRDSVRVGRTHGIHAEPTTWGHRVADLAFAMARSRDRLRRAREAVAVAKISGAVGTYSNIDPAVEQRVAARLGLTPAPAATQVVIRDGISEWVGALAVIATVCEAFALEVRHGQRTEVRELWEPFGKGQKGSSAMPHKKNPIASERIAGMARVVRAQVVPVMEGIPLWHERDISHSSPSASRCPTRPSPPTTCCTSRRAWSPGSSSTPTGCAPTSRAPAGSSTPAPCCSSWSTAGCRARTRTPSCSAPRCAPGRPGTPFRETLTAEAQAAGQALDEARLDEVCRPERYLDRLAPVFERLAALT